MIEPRDFFIAKEHNIRSFLSDGRKVFRIPDYQRNFSWTEEELEPFWNDFISTIEFNFDNNYNIRQQQRAHFFGTILLTKSNGAEFAITDGQQRLTVSTILLKCLLDISQRLTSLEQFAGIRAMIFPLIQRNEYDEPLQQTIYLDPTINNFYKEYILLRNNSDERDAYLILNPVREQNPPSAIQKLKQAHDFFVNKLNNDFPEEMSQQELHSKLNCYVKTFIRLFDLLELTVVDIGAAYKIFGTLNNRGKDLTDSDILKNEIFMSVSPANRPYIKEKWDYIIDCIDSEDLTDYLRFQFASSNGPLKKVDLLDSITKYILTNDPMVYLEQLRIESDWYARVRLIGPMHWSISITEKLEAFRTLDITHGIPLLLTGAVLFNHNNEAFERLVSATLTFCFRYLTIGRNTVDNLEKHIGNMSKKLRQTGNLSDTIVTMRSETPDAKFISEFKQYQTKSSNLAFYILYQLEKSKAGAGGVIPFDHSPSQHIEHIMPKKPTPNTGARAEEWLHVKLHPEYQDFVYRLGNQLILERDKNRSVSNKDFAFKKSIYQTSGLLYPREIFSNYSIWDFSTIEARQLLMAQDATKVWGY